MLEGQQIPEGTILVRTSSNRSRDRLACLLGTKPDYYWTWKTGGAFVAIPAALLAEARKIPGITKARPEGYLGRCFT